MYHICIHIYIHFLYTIYTYTHYMYTNTVLYPYLVTICIVSIYVICIHLNKKLWMFFFWPGQTARRDQATGLLSHTLGALDVSLPRLENIDFPKLV